MRFTAALVAGFAAATSAFLVPPNIPEDFKDLRFKGGPPEHVKDFVHALLEGRSTTYDLDCPGCPFAVESDKDGEITEWDYEGEESTLHLEFTTTGGTLELNGHPLLPIEEAQAQTTTVKVHQNRKDTGEQSARISLNFAMEVMPPMASLDEDDVSLIPVEFTVLGLQGIPVKVSTIALKLIQGQMKELVIVNSEEIPFEATPGAETCETARAWSICRLRAIVMARLKSMVETTKEKTDNVQEWVKTRCGGRKPHPHPHKHHGHHGHHGHGPHRYHRVGHMLHQTFRFFIIPALLGAIGGLAASVIGVLVGQTIVLLFRFFFRSEARPVRVVETEIVVVSDEKDELLAEEGLPEYEDAPLYKTVVQEDVEIRSEDEKQ